MLANPTTTRTSRASFEFEICPAVRWRGVPYLFVYFRFSPSSYSHFQFLCAHQIWVEIIFRNAMGRNPDGLQLIIFSAEFVPVLFAELRAFLPKLDPPIWNCPFPADVPLVHFVTTLRNCTQSHKARHGHNLFLTLFHFSTVVINGEILLRLC